MRLLNRDKQIILYANPSSVSARYDSYGNETGSPLITYEAPSEAVMVLTPTSGQEPYQPFGIGKGYTVIATTDDTNCPIDEESIIWIDASASSPHNYEVVGKAQSFNSIRYALREVAKS